MKKILFLIAAIVTMSFASCGNKTVATEANDSDTVVTDSVDTVVVDSMDSDSVCVL